MKAELHSGHKMQEHSETVGNICTEKVGPKAGEKDWEEVIKLDLSEIKYEPVLQKKDKLGNKKNVSSEDRWQMSQIQPATKLAKHFSVRYYVSVTTEFDGCICTDQPSNKTPMTIMPSVNPNAYGF